MNSLGNLFFFCWNISPRGMVFLFSGFQRKPQTWIAARMKHCYDQSPRLSCGPKCGPLSSPGPQRAVTSTSLWVTPLKQTSRVCCTGEFTEQWQILAWYPNSSTLQLQRTYKGIWSDYCPTFKGNFSQVPCTDSPCLSACKCAHAIANVGEMLLSWILRLFGFVGEACK